MFSQYDRSPDSPAGKNTPTQKAAFQGSITMHTTTSEARRFPCSIKTFDGFSCGVQYLALQVGFQSAKGLAGKNMQSYCNKRPCPGVEELVHRDCPYQFITNIISGIPYRRYLGIFTESVIQLGV